MNLKFRFTHAFILATMISLMSIGSGLASPMVEGLLKPELPKVGRTDWEVSNAVVEVPAAATGSTDIQTSLNNAGIVAALFNRLVDVVLTDNSTYTIDTPLKVPEGVRFRSTGYGALPKQWIMPDNNFPSDTAMVQLSSRTMLESLQFDGRNRAWRIVETTRSATDITVITNRMMATNNATTDNTDGWPYVSLLTIEPFSNRINLLFNNLSYAGLNPSGSFTAEARRGNPKTWGAIGAGIEVQLADNITILWNTIDEVITAGISLNRTTRVDVLGNNVSNVSRNSEWWNPDTNQIPLGDGITGYNNTVGTVHNTGERHWNIARNSINNSGNHGVHVSGMTILIEGNSIANAQQTDLFLGVTLNSAQTEYECSENIYIDKQQSFLFGANDAFAPRYVANPTPPTYSQRQVQVRHFMDESTGEILVDDSNFHQDDWIGPYPYYEEKNSGCQIRMAD